MVKNPKPMKPELDKNILIFLLSAIGLIVFPHVYHIPLIVFGFFLPVAELAIYRYLETKLAARQTGYFVTDRLRNRPAVQPTSRPIRA